VSGGLLSSAEDPIVLLDTALAHPPPGAPPPAAAAPPPPPAAAASARPAHKDLAALHQHSDGFSATGVALAVVSRSLHCPWRGCTTKHRENTNPKNSTSHGLKCFWASSILKKKIKSGQGQTVKNKCNSTFRTFG